MKLAAIYNVWDSEHLEESIKQIRDHVDTVIVVWQKLSNWGEISDEVEGVIMDLVFRKLVDIHLYYLPEKIGSTIQAIKNETEKRHRGLLTATRMGHSHFIHMDCDEYYDSEEFENAKLAIKFSEIENIMTLARIQNYYKLPTLKVDRLDDTLVPFISTIQGAKCGAKRHPNIYDVVDITRNTHSNYKMIEITMHHMSYVRKEGILQKIRNSTARKNIYTEKMLKEFNEAKAGTVLEHIWKGATLLETNNRFNVKN